MLVAPDWIVKKKQILDEIIKTMEKNGWKQGEFYEKREKIV